MVCLETTFIIDLLRGDEEVKDLREEFDKSEARITIASPSIMEIWTGSLLSNLSATEKVKINDLISSLTILSLDEVSAKQAGEIEAELIKSGNIIQTEDIMIAAIAMTNGEKLVTRDQGYTKIKGLRVLKY